MKLDLIINKGTNKCKPVSEKAVELLKQYDPFKTQDIELNKEINIDPFLEWCFVYCDDFKQHKLKVKIVK